MGKKKLLLSIGLALVLVVVGLVGCTSTTAAPIETDGIYITNQQQGIWVTGLGKVTVVPDIVSLRLGIEAQAASVAEAQAQAAEAMERVMDALRENGVAEKDIKTQYFSIYQVTKWDRDKEEPIVVGYRVINMVTAKIREIEQAGSVIDAVAVAGGDLIRIDSIGFSIDDPSAYYMEAREKAMVDAKAKAEQMAQLSGVTLGKPTYISEGGPQIPYYPPVMMDAAMASPEVVTPISPGEMEISLSVQVVYTILN